MESEMLQSPLLGLGEEDESDLTDWNLPLAFMKKRHCEKIEGSKSLAQSWRMKDRQGASSVFEYMFPITLLKPSASDKYPCQGVWNPLLHLSANLNFSA
uniref:Regulatory associated protein of MTOR complex 1 n=1 Tax=Apteryx owenii TaxID=8824 RepID=A0A8B9QFH2_APTOW